MTTAASPRIAPLEPPYAPDIEAEFARVMPPGMPPLTLFRTVGRNPRVLSRMVRGGLLDPGSIGLGERELIILRACARCGAEYEWGVHVAGFAAKAGFTPAQIAATRAADIDAELWDARQRLLLATVDALHERATLSDAEWQALGAEFDAAQCIEILMLAGLYHAVSFVVNALALEPEPFAARF